MQEVRQDYTIATKSNKRQLLNSFEIFEKPQDINITDIRFSPTSRGNFQDFVYVIFKCKYDCETIFTDEHVEEMQRFSEYITDDPLWSKVCRREATGNTLIPVDGVGCSQHSYFNITRFNTLAEEKINKTEKITGTKVDKEIHL